MGSFVCAAACTLFTWSADNLKGFSYANPFAKLGLPTPKGRVRRITHEELAIIDQASIGIGRPELGDAFHLGVLTAQRRTDLCRLGWDIKRTGRVKLTQQKTKVVVDFRAPQALMQRVDAIWKRHHAAGVVNMDRLLISPHGAAYDDNPARLTKHLADLRARAVELQRTAGQRVTLDDVVLHDSRDTAVIERFEAGSDAARVAEHSGHSLKHLDMIKKSYLGNNRVLADQGTDALDTAWSKNAKKKRR